MTAARDVGLIILLALLMRWPDTSMASDLLQGYPAVGHCLWSGIFPPRYGPLSDRSDIFFEGARMYIRGKG